MKRNVIALGTRMALALGSLAVLLTPAVHAAEVFQDLEEITSRFGRLKSKPLEELISEDSAYQPEMVIFRDTETVAELWSFTREECVEYANGDLGRTPWNCDGSLIAFMGNRAFRAPNGKIAKVGWSGFSYLMRADGTNPRKFYATNPGGGKTGMQDGFSIWDRKDPAALYISRAVKTRKGYRQWDRGRNNSELYLVRIRMGPGLKKNTIEPLYKFPNGRLKAIHGISDNNRLLIKDRNGKSMQDMPNFYVVDLNKKPAAAGFARYHTLGYGGLKGYAKHDPNNEYRMHAIHISRDGKTVSWGYGSARRSGELVGFSVPADNLEGPPKYGSEKTDQWGQYRSHAGGWSDGRQAYYSEPSRQIRDAGGYAGKWVYGIWVRHPGKVPVFMGKSMPNGHCVWNGGDPDWFFAHTTRNDNQNALKWIEWQDAIVAGKADGSVLKIICRPYARRRPGKAPYHGYPRPLQSPDATKCWFHSSMLMPANKFTGSFIAVFRRPHAPVKVTAKRVAVGVALAWTPHSVSREVKGYHVYRGDGSAKGFVEVTKEAIAGTTFTDKTAKRGNSFTYFVTSEEWSRLESDVSSPVVLVSAAGAGRVLKQNGISGWDKAPPTPVTGFKVKKAGEGQFALNWTAVADSDLRYYNIYASSAGKLKPEQKRLLVSPPRGETAYLDWTAPPGREIHYAIVAVDRQGNASAPVFAVGK